MEKAKDTKVHKKWYKSTWFTILMLIFLAPVGIFLTWKYSSWSKVWKIIASLAAALFLVYAIVVTANAAPTLTVDNAKNGRIETQDSSYTITGTITGANGSTTLTVNDTPAQINNGKYSAVVELKEGDNTIIISAKKKDKAVQESIIIHRLTTAEIQARKEAEAAKQKAEQEAAAKSKAEADAAAAAKKAADDKKAAEDAAAAKAAADKKAAEDAVKNAPAEYKSALSQANSYANTMHMSKQGVYDQLVSEYGGKFTAPAAQYTIDNVKADWNANALAKAKDYQNTMHLSPAAIHDQLTSAYGEKFTQAEADYAIQHL
jgi:bifunctional DNA-binding transcriptional regulator/antitoxin component of YhaV-PrlF toxin-antitoxin module